ncbi:PLP-dependent aminotransferase family protein [Streptomyces sp. CA-111067]|uniref:aminotransferase-like domain-containing protein n=1 Tax=Streptomyces sp. CA-111067 TaxID=3240046 RepID=UPI003D973374
MNRSKRRRSDRSTTPAASSDSTASTASGADFLQLRAEDAPVGGLSGWLTDHLRRAIADGRLPVGTKLPPSRTLAADLQVSRGVITEAYRRLAEDGHVEGRGRAGTVVLTSPTLSRPAADPGTTRRPPPAPASRPENRPVLTPPAQPPAAGPPVPPPSAAATKRWTGNEPGPRKPTPPADPSSAGRATADPARSASRSRLSTGDRVDPPPATTAGPGRSAGHATPGPALGAPAGRSSNGERPGGRTGPSGADRATDDPPPGPRGGRRSGGSGVFRQPVGYGVFDAVRDVPARVDLSPGVPDLAAFPRAAWLRAERQVFAELPAAGFGYGDPRGALPLRRAVSTWLARNRGFVADPDEIVIVAGTAQALTLFGQVLRAHGVDRVALEDPGSLGVRQHLAHGLGGGPDPTPPVPVDGDGLDVGALRETGAAAVCVTPAHQFPLGVVLSGARRRELAGWAVERGGLVIEDDYDAEHRYDRPPVAALRAVLPDRVWYAGSVSKLLAPALRMGWVVVPAPYREAVVEAKRFADLGSPALPQLVLARLMESGALERQLRLLRQRHRRRRDALREALGGLLPARGPGRAVVHGAAAGLYLTVTFEGGFADTDLAAGSLERGVKVQPLSWHRQRPGPPGLVLGYAANPPDVLAGAVAEVGAALRGLL